MKTEYYWTYNELVDYYKISKSALTHRVQRLNIKGKRLDNDSTVYFNIDQVKKIINYLDFKNKENHPRKIKIVDMYEKGMTGNTISKKLNISIKLTYDCIKEYNLSGYLIVESKLNNMEL